MKAPSLCAAALLLALAVPAGAEMPANGQFTAGRACPALQSIRKETNPGAVMTEPGASYEIIAANCKKPTFYRIEVPGAEPPERWVDAACGTVAAPGRAPKQAAPSQPRAASYVLAISWQPAFCESASGKPEWCLQKRNGHHGCLV